MILKLEVMGKAARQGTGKNRKRFAYTPEKTVLYENLIKTEYQRHCGLHRFSTIPNSELKQPLKMHITAIFGIPKSFTKGKRLAAERNEIRPQVKPDCDNVAKVICDAL